jgi:WD domain, G-beta repeat
MRTQSLGFVLLALALGHTTGCSRTAPDPDKQPDDLVPTQVLDHGEFFRPASLGGRDLILLSLAFSPDGKVIASAGGGHLGGQEGPAKGEVKLWDVATGKALQTIAVENGIVFHATFSPDGKLLATASGPGTPVCTWPGEIHLWNPATGELVRKLQGHDCGAYVVAFSPAGKLLASGGIATMDKAKMTTVRGQHATGDLKLWDLETGKELWTQGGHTGTVGSLVFSADGRTLASSGGLFDGKVKLWDVAAGTHLGTLESEAEVVGPVAFGANAATLIVLSNNPTGKEEGPQFMVQVSLWDTVQKKQVKAANVKNGNVYRMALSHHKNLIACACHDGVKVYDVAKQVEVRGLPSKFRIRPVAFSPDDGLLAAGCDEGTVKLWSVAKLRK